MRIIIIDDERIHNFISMRLFRQVDPAIEIHDFTDPLDALSLLSELNPDIIFLDLNMPNISGWEFLDLMAEKNISHKVIILTSSVSSLDHDKAKTYRNVLHCTEKPMKKEKLVTIVAAYKAQTASVN